MLQFYCGQLDISQNMEPDPGVLCINCEEFIPADLIEGHSTSCTQVNFRVITADNGRGLERSALRLEKLLELIIRQMATSSMPGEMAYYKILQKLCLQLLNVTGVSQSNSNDSAAESLSSLIATFRGSQSVLICAERLRSLVSIQKSELDELRLQDSKQQVNEIQAQIEFFKARTQKLEQALTKVSSQDLELEEVVSQISSNKTKSDGSSHRSSESSDHLGSPLHEVEDLLVDSQSRDSPLDNLQRYFYSQCLAIKLSIPSKSSAQQVPIGELFEEAKIQHIPVEGWPDFIKQRLNIVIEEVGFKRQRRRNQRSTIRNRLNYCETIVEDESES